MQFRLMEVPPGKGGGVMKRRAGRVWVAIMADPLYIIPLCTQLVTKEINNLTQNITKKYLIASVVSEIIDHRMS